MGCFETLPTPNSIGIFLLESWTFILATKNHFLQYHFDDFKNYLWALSAHANCLYLQKRPRRITKEEKNKQKNEMESYLFANTDNLKKLKVVQIEGKGRGVIADTDFEKDEFIVEYAGELISAKEGNSRDKKYASENIPGGFIFFFRCSEKALCIDATPETGRLGRPLNQFSGYQISKLFFFCPF